MYNSMLNDDLYSVPKKFSADQPSNMAKYGRMGILGDVKPPSRTSSSINYGNSITDFHQQLSLMSQNQQFRIKKKYLQRNKRAYTQIQNHSSSSNNHDQISTQKHSARSSTMTPIIINTRGNTKDSTKELHEQLEEIKRMIEEQRKVNSMEERFEKLYQEIERKSSQQQQMMYGNPYGQLPPMMYPPPPPAYMYNNHPYHHHPPPQQPSYSRNSHRRHRKPSSYSSTTQSNFPLTKTRTINSRQHSTTKKPTNNRLNRKWATSLLKKYFYAVTFTFLLRKQAKKIALIRKANLRKFWLEKFQSQVVNIKNWLLQSMKYTLAIILQKKQLNFDFTTQRRPKVRKQKQKLILQLVYLCVEQMKKLANPKDVSMFGEILVVVCRNGSFPISRFWTINQIEKLRVSEYYGFVRADEWMEKLMILLFVFIKVLIFNMLLQPYKFDSINFTKTTQPLLSNMYLLASLLYHIVTQIIQQYLNQPKPHPMYQPGNWLNVKKEFITECCQPLVFNANQYEKGQYISGMLEKEVFGEMLKDEENFKKWQAIREKIRGVIDSLYIEMKAKGKMLKSNIKFKMYN